MFTEDGGVLHFNTPKVQAAVGANTYAPGQMNGSRFCHIQQLMIPHPLCGFFGANVYLFPLNFQQLMIPLPLRGFLVMLESGLWVDLPKEPVLFVCFGHRTQMMFFSFLGEPYCPTWFILIHASYNIKRNLFLDQS